MNNADATEIMAPDAVVPIVGGLITVIVREMNWKAAKLFLSNLAPYSEQFLQVDPQGTGVKIDQAKLISVLMTALGEELIMASTGNTRQWVDALASVDFFALLQKAVELNVRPEMLTHVGQILGQFRSVLPKLT